MLVVYPAQNVYAAFTFISCNTQNGEVISGGLFDPAQISDSGACGKITTSNIFSGISCNYLVIVNEVFTKFYCYLQAGLGDIIVAATVLFIALFGIKLLIGMQRPNASAGLVGVMKIGFVYFFTTQGAMGVGLILNFFFALIIQTVSWSVNAIQCRTLICVNGPNDGNTIANIFKGVDDKVNGIIMGVQTGTGQLAGLFANNAVLVALFFALAWAATPLFYLAWELLWMTVMLFIKSLVTFMLSITAIAFLVALSPIFLCFMLFDSTRMLFDNWLNFLVSYSLQPLIIFCIFSVWILISSDFIGFAQQLTSVMTVITNDTKDKASVLTKTDSLMFCEIQAAPPPMSSFSSADFADVMPVSTFIDALLNAGGPGIGCKGGGTAQDRADERAKAALEGRTADRDAIKLVEPQAALNNPLLIEYLVYNFLDFAVVAYAFLQLINLIPKMAQSLSRSQVGIPLGAGFGGGSGMGDYISRATSGVRNSVGKMAQKPVDDLTGSLKKMTTTR